MSDVEMTKPGGIAVDALADPSVTAVGAVSAGAATMLPQERRMTMRSLAGYFLSPKATRLLPLIATLSTIRVVVSLELVAGGTESKG